MTLTGRQIREARRLLRWSKAYLSRRASVTLDIINAIESCDGAAWLQEEQESAIRRALDAAGVEVISENGGGTGVRLRAGEP